MKDNSTGKNKDFYSRGKQMFDRIQPLKPPIQEDIDLLYKANSADIEALEDAKMTLNVIKEMEPTFAGIINSSLSLFSLRQLRRIRKIHHQSERIKYPNSPQKPKRTLFARNTRQN